MSEDFWDMLEQEFQRFPVLRVEGVTDAEIDAASADIGIPFPADYREFLRRYDGSTVGAFHMLGVRALKATGGSTETLTAVNRSFREDNWPHIEEWLIIAVDHGGNPMGFAPDGHIWVSDHDFGVVEPIAYDFQDFIRNYCLGP